MKTEGTKITRPMSESRKIRKPLMERKRRERINASLEQLAVLLKEAKVVAQDKPVSKIEKADILELTVQHLMKNCAVKKKEERGESSGLQKANSDNQESRVNVKSESAAIPQNIESNDFPVRAIVNQGVSTSKISPAVESKDSNKETYKKGFQSCIHTIKEVLKTSAVTNEQPVEERLINHLTKYLDTLPHEPESPMNNCSAGKLKSSQAVQVNQTDGNNSASSSSRDVPLIANGPEGYPLHRSTVGSSYQFSPSVSSSSTYHPAGPSTSKNLTPFYDPVKSNSRQFKQLGNSTKNQRTPLATLDQNILPSPFSNTLNRIPDRPKPFNNAENVNNVNVSSRAPLRSIGNIMPNQHDMSGVVPNQHARSGVMLKQRDGRNHPYRRPQEVNHVAQPNNQPDNQDQITSRVWRPW